MNSIAGFNTGLEGILCITRESFDSVQKTENLLYIVKEIEGFSLYLGGIPLTVSSVAEIQETLETDYLKGKPMTQEEYDRITPATDTLYVIAG